MKLQTKNIGTLLILFTTTFGFQVQAETIVFDHINVIPMDQEHVLFDQRVIVVDDKIATIEPATTKLTVKADRTINCQGQFMLPGFSDTHYHQRVEKEEYQLLYNLLIANGITSIRNMSEDRHQDAIAIREHANNKSELAPFYFTVGPQVNQSNVKTPEDAIKMVQNHKDRGYDFIKVHGNLHKKAYLTLLEEAEKQDIPVVGHTQRDKPLEYSLRLASIAHMEDIVMVFSEEGVKIAEINDQLAQQIARQVKDSGVYVSPTLGVVAQIQDFTDDIRFEKLKQRSVNRYLSKSVLHDSTGPDAYSRQDIFLSPFGLEYIDKIISASKKLTLAMHNAGVPLMVGTDNFGMQVTGFSYHDEMKLMHEAGIPAYDVLKAATVTSARYLKRYASAGTISEGKNAEFVILSGNPLRNIEHTRDIVGIMLKDRWLDRKALDVLLQEVLNANRK